MTWNFYDDEEFILKEKKNVKKELLDTLTPKERKRIKKGSCKEGNKINGA